MAETPAHDITQLLQAWSEGDECAIDARRSRVVELRFSGGLSMEETAEVLKVSPETVMRDWKVAKAWLGRALSGEKRDEA
jgi:DNA-directed RNA polymerase specialized sigma24 family protein